MKVPSLPTEPISIDTLQSFGVTDPQIRIFNDKAYLYASHDTDPQSTKFVMPDWQLWTSNDLVNWKYETTLDPRQTHIGQSFNGCWAGDAICKDGTYYWCFSIVDQETGAHEIGLVSAPHAEGPWSDPIGEAWIAADAADTHVYDPGLMQLENGDIYIVFGVWDYYIARIADDMSGLAETPRKVEINDPEGPYGKGKTDDKPFLHKRGDLFYLSWGCFYATSPNLYGPYNYKGCLVDENRMERSFKAKTWPHGPQQGRHGSFFDWKGQSYFMYCDMSFSGNRYYRGSWISYIHYREDGSIAPIEITSLAVGRYHANTQISAANYFSGSGIQKLEHSKNCFSISPCEDKAFAHFPNIIGLETDSVSLLLTASTGCEAAEILISNGEASQPTSLRIPPHQTQTSHKIVMSRFDPGEGIKLSFPQKGWTELSLHSLQVIADHQKNQ